MGKYKESYQAACEAIYSDPNNSLLYLNAGKSLLAMNRTKEAYDYFDKVTQLDPKSCVGVYYKVFPRFCFKVTQIGQSVEFVWNARTSN